MQFDSPHRPKLVDDWPVNNIDRCSSGWHLFDPLALTECDPAELHAVLLELRRKVAIATTHRLGRFGQGDSVGGE